MNKNVVARKFSLAFVVVLAVMLLASATQAFALSGVNAQATSDKDSYAANTWAPLRVSINNESAYEIQVLEAGFESVPAGLEYRKALSTTYAEGDFIVSSGSSGYAMAHEMEVRKVVTSPKSDPEKKTSTPTTPSKTTAKTSDGVHPLLLVLVLVAAAALAVYAARRMKQGGMLSLLIAGFLAAGGLGTLAAVPVPSASAAATTETAECEITIAIDGSDYTFNSYITYTYITPAPTPDPEPEPEPEPETIDVTGTKKWEGDGGKEHDNATEVKLTLYRQVDGGDFEEVSGATPTWNGDAYTFAAQPKSDASGAEYTYYVSEEDVEGYDREYTNADGAQGLDFAPNGGIIVNTLIPSSVNINVGLIYRVYDGGAWGGVVASPQTVTISGGSLTEDKTLTFTPGTAAQKVELPGAGTYTIAMTGIGKGDLKPEVDLSALTGDPMPIIIDTVSATVTVDESGNCTVGNTTCTSFAFGSDQGGNFIYNDIPALKEAYGGTGADDRLNTLNPHSSDAGASASGNTVTLTTVMSQGWDDSTDESEQ